MNLNDSSDFFTSLASRINLANNKINEDLEEDKEEEIPANLTLRTQTNGTGITKVIASDLRNFVKEKNDLYTILAI